MTPIRSAAAASAKIAAALLALCFTLGAQAATAWSESSSGDLSNDGLAPTLLSFGLGSNTVFGGAGNSGEGIDRDYFSFVVPVGMALTGLTLLDGTSISGASSFLGLQAGPQLTVTPSGAGVENLLGFLHYGNDQIGTDLLPTLAVGMTGGLPSGAYSVWVQETGGSIQYGFDFAISAVPEPFGASLLAVGLLVLAVKRRRAATWPSSARPAGRCLPPPGRHAPAMGLQPCRGSLRQLGGLGGLTCSPPLGSARRPSPAGGDAAPRVRRAALRPGDEDGVDLSLSRARAHCRVARVQACCTAVLNRSQPLCGWRRSHSARASGSISSQSRPW